MNQNRRDAAAMWARRDSDAGFIRRAGMDILPAIGSARMAQKDPPSAASWPGKEEKRPVPADISTCTDLVCADTVA